MAQTNPYLKAAIMEIVENQLRDNDPPETRQTYERLLSDGQSEQEAKRLIGCVVVSEIFDVLKHKQPFDPVRFAEALSRLPVFPWED